MVLELAHGNSSPRGALNTPPRDRVSGRIKINRHIISRDHSK
jgi:hypothetical protein